MQKSEWTFRNNVKIKAFSTYMELADGASKNTRNIFEL